VLEIDQGFLVHTTNGVRVPPKKFKGEHLKFELKFFHHVRAYNFGRSGSNLTKLNQEMCCEADMTMWVQLLEGMPSTKFGRARTSKIQDYFDNFRL